MGAPNTACKAVVELASRRRRRCRTETKGDDDDDDDGDNNKKEGEKAPAVQNRTQENNRKVADVACIRS
jgi:hypothetical protein